MRRQRGMVAVAAQHGVARVSVAPELLDGRLQLRLDAQQRVLRQVVRNERRPLEEQRQVVLDAGGDDALRDVLVDAAARRVALELLAEVATEPGLGRLVQRELARRQQPHLVHLVDRALGVHVEAADALHHVVVELDAVGHRAAHRKEIDQAAAHAVLAGRHHLRDVRVSRRRELGTQLIGREPCSLFEMERAGGQILHGREPAERRRDRQDHHLERAPGKLIERREPLGDQVLVRRKLVVGERLPVGKQAHLDRRIEKRNLVQQPLRVRPGSGDDGDGMARSRELRDQQRVGGAVEGRRTRTAPRRRHLGRDKH